MLRTNSTQLNAYLYEKFYHDCMNEWKNIKLNETLLYDLEIIIAYEVLQYQSHDTDF